MSESAEVTRGDTTYVITSPRVAIEIERMAKGPPKVSVKITGDNSESVAAEVLARYKELMAAFTDRPHKDDADEPAPEA
jgi:hypothetical protein